MVNKVEFSRWKNVPEVVKTAEEIGAAADRYLRIAASDTPEDKVQARKLWMQLSDKYWDMLYALVDAQTESFPAVLTFDEQERLFIDFGYLNDTITPRNKKFDLSVALKSKSSVGVFPYQAFSDFIAECWAMITGQSTPVPTCGIPTEKRIKGLEGQLTSLQQERDAELRMILSRDKNLSREELAEVLADMSQYLLTATKVSMRVKEYREAKDDVKQGMSQDRFRYNEAEKTMNIQLSIAQKDVIEPLGLPEYEEFMNLHEAIKILARKIVYTLQETEKSQRRARRVTAACAEFSQQMMRKELKNMLVKKREYMAVPAKTARCDLSFLNPQDSEPALYQTSSTMVEEMSNLDMDMFSVARIRMYGVPRVIFIPGQGFGTYDWADHTILLPVFPTTSVEKALAYGLATFRWDSDEDRILKNTYENIKDNKGKSILEMAKSFYKDYFLWITKEKKGYRILPRDTHKTFVQMFAPRKQED
ncbi:MAG: hypothetical protein LBD04_01490 [Synergistaceae bacterium]|jgi:hypothetical protein|nr:hypothetical protein [Synergistaceae bacterium]